MSTPLALPSRPFDFLFPETRIPAAKAVDAPSRPRIARDTPLPLEETPTASENLRELGDKVSLMAYCGM